MIDNPHLDSHQHEIVISCRHSVHPLPMTTMFGQSINQRNFYSAPYKTWTAALDNVNVNTQT